jgi:hypothetical protein
MASRLNLQSVLETVLGSRNVYFQPPESLKLKYPCIIYEEVRGRSFRANDKLYSYRKCYNLIVIDKDPDSTIPDRLRELPLCDTDRIYKSDNLYHFSFTLYY